MFNFFLTLLTLFPMAVYEQGDGSPELSRYSHVVEYPQGICSIEMTSDASSETVAIEEIGCDFFALTIDQKRVLTTEIAKFGGVKSVYIEFLSGWKDKEMLFVGVEGWIQTDKMITPPRKFSLLRANFRRSGETGVFWEDIVLKSSNFSGKEFDKDGRQNGIWSREEH